MRNADAFAQRADGTTAWIGTSNWSGGYFDNSRNLELVLNNASMAARVDALYSQLWNSRYAAPIKVDFDYPVPDLSFNATGGDGYPHIDTRPGYVNTGFIDAEVLKEYIQKNSPLDAAAYEPKGEVSWQ